MAENYAENLITTKTAWKLRNLSEPFIKVAA